MHLFEYDIEFSVDTEAKIGRAIAYALSAEYRRPSRTVRIRSGECGAG